MTFKNVRQKSIYCFANIHKGFKNLISYRLLNILKSSGKSINFKKQRTPVHSVFV